MYLPSSSNLKPLAMKNIIFLFVSLALSTLTLSAQEIREISGIVTDGTNPISDVKVSVLDRNTTTTSDKFGKYAISVNSGDVLTYSYMGMKTINIRIEEVTRFLSPVMIPEVNELDGVTVTKTRGALQNELEADYHKDKFILKTAFGYVHAQKTAGRVRIMNEDIFRRGNLCVLDLIRSSWAGVNVYGDCVVGGTVGIRDATTLGANAGAIWDIDGMIWLEAPIWLDVLNIKRIGILSSLAQTITYGGLGSGGVIVINTTPVMEATNKITDRALLRNNFYKGDAIDKDGVKSNWPEYKKELYASKSLEAAVRTFDRLVKTYSNSPYFLLDVQAYFTNELGNADLGDELIDHYFNPFKENPVLLKALAYQYQEQGQYEKANNTYKEVFLLRPHYAQSYLDLARSYREIGSPRKAAALHARYGYLLEEGFMEIDTLRFGPIMEREFDNLLALEKDEILDKNGRKKLSETESGFNGTRMVFEWNDGEAEFDLQFVDPRKQYSKLEHSLADNSDLIWHEKSLGYNTSEQLLYGPLDGTWQVNVTYLGNKSLTPTYLKATVYYNYGTIAQRKEVKVFKLSLKDVNQELFKIGSNAAMVMK